MLTAPKLHLVGLDDSESERVTQLKPLSYTDGHNIVVFSGKDKSSIHDAFIRHASYFIDAQTIAQLDLPGVLDAGLKKQCMIVILGTETAYRFPIAIDIAGAIRVHHALAKTTVPELETALHEAISNAVIHGNLGVQGALDTMEGFIAFYEEIEARIGSGIAANKKVNITSNVTDGVLSVLVSDDGAGFEPSEVKHSTQADMFSGKGTMVMQHFTRKLAYHNGGTGVEMQFRIGAS